MSACPPGLPQGYTIRMGSLSFRGVLRRSHSYALHTFSRWHSWSQRALLQWALQ